MTHQSRNRPWSIRKLLLAVLLLWNVFGLARATILTVESWRNRATFNLPPLYWRLGAPRPEELRHCAEFAGRFVPRGSRIVVADAEADFFRWRWAAYLLPAHDVLDTSSVESADFLLFVGKETFPPRGTLARQEPPCSIYRLR